MTAANNTQVGGDHYKAASGLQHWDLMSGFGPSYFVGNITKYLTRWRSKNGLEDLRKSGHYLDKLRELVVLDGLRPDAPLSIRDFASFIASNQVPEPEAAIMALVFFWKSDDDLLEAVQRLSDLTHQEAVRLHDIEASRKRKRK